MLRKILGVSLAALMTLTSATSAFALTPESGLLDATGNYANSTGSVVADKDATDIDSVVGKDTTQGEYSQYDVVVDDYTGTTLDSFESETEVYATVLPAYSIKIPKTIILSASGLGFYDIGVKGDMSGAQTLTIKPEDKIADTEDVDFYMSEQGAFVGAKDDVVATVEQDKTEWRYSDINKDDFTWLENAGKITATLTAGSWAGTFSFIIDMDVIGSISVSELEEKYDLQYYSALHLAVTDINNDAIGENADVPKEEAVAAAYIDEEGNANAVLLKDSTESTKTAPSVDMTINLGGNTLFLAKGVGIDLISGNVTIDGRIKGSVISVAPTASNTNTIQARSGHLTILGGTYSAKTVDNYSCRVLMNATNVTFKDATIIANAELAAASGINSQSGNVEVINCDIKSYSSSEYAYGIANNGNGSVSVSDCDINAESAYKSVGIRNTGSLSVSNSEVIATSPYLGTNEEGYTNTSIGISNVNGSAEIYNCHVKGAHSAVNTENTNIYVDGGVYEGYGHGGFYLTGDGNTTAHIKNATLIDCDWYGPYESNDWMTNNAGIYVGGSDSDDGSGDMTSHNFTLYMDNCNIIADRQAIVLRGTAGESGHKVYASNTTISDGSYIRIDSLTHTLYVGQGCNFTADNCYHNTLTPEELASRVVYTDEVYTF